MAVATERNLRATFISLGACVLACMGLLSACATTRDSRVAVANVSFSDYQRETLRVLETERSFQLADKRSELLWNAPNEWQPATIAGARPKRGILLVHGLGDSPWSFHDLAPQLAAQGFLVRTVLLPGHGTRPEALLNVTAEEWQAVVYAQAQTLEEDVDGPVYLGGFSTGANLVLSYAYGHPEIAGLVLFSPGFKSFPFGWITSLVARVRPWMVSPSDSIANQTPVRYMNVPTNGYAQFYRTSALAQRLLNRPYEKPVFMVVAQHDSVINTDYLLRVFQSSFTNPRSRLIWYGEKPEGLIDTRRILVRPDRIPELQISQFSHMGLLFSASNALYGSHGSLRICLNSLSKLNTQACERGEPLWYSDWGYSEAGKYHARLTYNPYFDWQNSIMAGVITWHGASSQNMD